MNGNDRLALFLWIDTCHCSRESTLSVFLSGDDEDQNYTWVVMNMESDLKSCSFLGMSQLLGHHGQMISLFIFCHFQPQLLFSRYFSNFLVLLMLYFFPETWAWEFAYGLSVMPGNGIEDWEEWEKEEKPGGEYVTSCE